MIVINNQIKSDFNIKEVNFDLREKPYNLMVKRVLDSIKEKNFSSPNFKKEYKFCVIIKGEENFLLVKRDTISSIEQMLFISYETGKAQFCDFPQSKIEFIESIKKYPSICLDDPVLLSQAPCQLDSSPLKKSSEAPWELFSSKSKKTSQVPLKTDSSESEKSFSAKPKKLDICLNFKKWIGQNEFLLEKSLEWRQILESNSLLDLEDPVSALSLYFDEKNLNEIEKNKNNSLIGWLIFIQKVLEGEKSQTLSLIQKHALGYKLNQFADMILKASLSEKEDVLVQLGQQVLGLSAHLIKALTKHYFSNSVYFETSQLGLKKSYALDKNQVEDIQKATENLSNDSYQKKGYAYIFAKDSFTNQLRVTRSGRMWSIVGTELKEWRGLRSKWKKNLSSYNLSFTTLVTTSFTLKLIEDTLKNYVDHCTSLGKTKLISRLTDEAKITGSFLHLLETLLLGRDDKKNQLFILNVLRLYFSQAFSEKKWSALFSLIEQPSLDLNEVKQLILIGKCKEVANLARLNSTLTCGEVKIALDCCREISVVPKESRASLPPTLGDHLEFFAFINKKDETKELKFLEVCQKCQEMWPALEGLYWAIKESGLNMPLMENLSKSFYKFN